MDQPVDEQVDQQAERSVRYEVADGVGTLTFARPDAMNALDVATKEQLLAAVTAAAADPAVRCVLLTGTGRAFCVGQDLREHVRLLGAGDESLWRTVPEHYNPTVTALATMDKPVVAALNGVAAGAGASLAMAADLRLLAASAGFNLAFTGVALSADTGASYFLPRLVGLGRAKDLLLRPRTVGAEEALAIGLATEVVPDDELPARAREVAVALAAGPTAAYAAIRRVVAYSAEHPLTEALEHEAHHMAATGGTADHAEAVQAFLEKRPPRFTGA
ncbi:enoyl-CoA hydratase-related protein [Angustibacter speluncae]